METYLVGGAVRDRLLNIPIKDRDWVVVHGTPKQMLDAGFKQVGADFPVFLHPETQEEYALARTERKKGHGYQGFEVYFSNDVSLEEDLVRRDLTINAMAQDSQGRIIDPYHGQKDIDDKVLRHVSMAFIEDPLRVLRVARFAARYHSLGFKVANETSLLMKKIAQKGELAHLTEERIWQETERALNESSPWVYFQTLRTSCGLVAVFPEVDSLFIDNQDFNPGQHAIACLQTAAHKKTNTEIRFALLVHNLATSCETKDLGIKLIESLCTRIKAPNNYKKLALKVAQCFQSIHLALELTAEQLWDVIKTCDGLRLPEQFHQVLLASECDYLSRAHQSDVQYPQKLLMESALNTVTSITAKKLMDKGLTGKALGEALEIERINALQNLIDQSTLHT